MTTRKRKVSTISSNRNTKRAKISASKPILIEDADDGSNIDPELQGILAQIKAQEESERVAKGLDEPVASGSKDLGGVLQLDVDEEDFQEILGRIKAQEESEGLAAF